MKASSTASVRCVPLLNTSFNMYRLDIENESPEIIIHSHVLAYTSDCASHLSNSIEYAGCLSFFPFFCFYSSPSQAQSRTHLHIYLVVCLFIAMAYWSIFRPQFKIVNNLLLFLSSNFIVCSLLISSHTQ